MYDALDFMRGIEVLLKLRTRASLVALRRGLRSIGMGGVPDMQKPGSTPGQGRRSAANQWVNWTELDFNTVHANDFRF
jgi:hypothetical protein